MNLIVKTAPQTGIITLEDARKHLVDETFTDEDAKITSLIKGFTKTLESGTGKRTITQTLELYFDSWQELEEHKIRQGKIKSDFTLKYLDENRVENPITEFVSVGVGTDEGRVVFNSSFTKPDIWGLESVILTVEVGEDTAPDEVIFILKLMLSGFWENKDVSGIVDPYIRNNKYRSF
ncbi:MAG: hypothetical protein GY760_14210 [Deltaproteobacteria bacterium]|nr:hypothetical protein [Deltaproteobacteria bacterium]